MVFKATVRNKETGQSTVIESEYNLKSDFVKDLRSNGYSVVRAEPKEVFDFVIENTNGTKYDWEDTKKLYKADVPLSRNAIDMMRDGMNTDEIKAKISSSRGIGSTSTSGTGR